MSKEYEKLLQDLLDTEEGGDVAPESRVEAYLLALLEKTGGSGGSSGGGGSGLTQINATTFPLGADETPLTEEENAAFSAAAAAKNPVVVSMSTNAMGAPITVSLVCNYTEINMDEDMFYRVFTGMAFLLEGLTAVAFMSEDGVNWVATMSSMDGNQE